MSEYGTFGFHTLITAMSGKRKDILKYNLMNVCISHVISIRFVKKTKSIYMINFRDFGSRLLS